MTDLEIIPTHELIRQSRRHKRAAAGHVVMLMGNLAVLFLDQSRPVQELISSENMAIVTAFHHQTATFSSD